MLYYLWAFTGQRAARYWGYLISGSGASHGSSDLKQRSNSTSTKTTSSPALAVDSSGSPTSLQLSSSPHCRAVDSLAAEAVIMSEFEVTASGHHVYYPGVTWWFSAVCISALQLTQRALIYFESLWVVCVLI